MPIQTRLSISTQDFNKGMKNAANTANSALGGIQKGSKVAQTAVDNIGRSASSMAGTAGRAVSTVTSTLAKMGPVGLAVAGVFAGVSLAITGVVKGLNALGSKIDSVAKSAKSIGMSVNGMMATKFAAGRAGMDFNRTIDSIQKLEAAWEKATKGERKYIDMFKELGVDLSKDWSAAPERLYGSVTNALSAGKKSSTLEELLGRRGMREANKAAANKFDRDLSLASTLGIEFDERSVANAERLVTATGQLSDSFLTMLANTKLLSDGMEALAKVQEGLIASTKKGRPLAENESYENVYNVVEDALLGKNKENANKIDQDFIDKIFGVDYNAISMIGGATPDVQSRVSFEDWNSKAITAEEIKKALRNVAVEDVARLASRLDERFDANNQDTWVQTKKDTRTDEEKKLTNAYQDLLFSLRNGKSKQDALNALEEEERQLLEKLTKEQREELDEAEREGRAGRWEDVYKQVSKDLTAVGAEKIKQELSLEGFNESVMKYIESAAKALLGDNGLQQLYARHGGTAEGFKEAYLEGRLFTPFAEDSMSDKTRRLMQDNNISFNEEGIKAAERYIAEQNKAAEETKAHTDSIRNDIEANNRIIAELDAERAALKENIDLSKASSRVLKKLISNIITVGSIRGNGVPFDINPGLTEEEIKKALASRNIYDKKADEKSNEFADNLAKAVDLTAANQALEEQARQAEAAANAQLKAAEDMQKAVKEMKQFYEVQNIDTEIQRLLREAEAIDYAKLLNAQVDARKVAEGQYEVEKTRFSSGGNSRQIAEAQAEAMMKAAGLTITPGALKGLAEDIYRNMQAQAKVGIQRMMQSQLYANEDWQMGKGGARGAGMKAVADAVRAFGDTLSQEQKNLIGRSAELKYNADNWRTLERKGNQFATNELTSRGGFRTGVTQVQRDNIKDVISNQKRYIQIMESMNRTNQDIARLLTN